MSLVRSRKAVGMNLPIMTFNGKPLTETQHDMAMTEGKMHLANFKDFKELDPMEQMQINQLIDMFVMTYLNILQDNLLKDFDTELTH